MSDSTRRTVVLVDRHPLWLETLAQVCERASLVVRAKLTSSAAACERIAELQPALLITGIRMAADEMDGIALTRRVRETVPGIKVMVLSSYEDREHIDAALAAGAEAYVFKSAHPDDLLSAIRQAFRHSVYFAGARPQANAGNGAPAAPAGAGAGAALTRRELEILQLVAHGHSNAELARMLWVTEQTVKFHLSNIYRKLNVANRTEASHRAQLQGLLVQPEPDADEPGALHPLGTGRTATSG